MENHAMSKPQQVEFESATPNMLVTDVPAAAKFYTEKLGFAVTMDAADNNFVTLSRGNVILSVIGSKTAAGKSWCSFTVSNPALLFAEYTRAGVTIHRPLETWGEHTEFSILDLDGNRMDIGNAMTP
jgi:hypothetical protein